MGLNLVVTALVMLLAVLLSAPGVAAGVIAITVSFLVEIEFLRRKVRKESKNSRIQEFKNESGTGAKPEPFLDS